MIDGFFTSDTHFGSARTLRFSKRPFDNVAEMNFALIEAINALPPNAPLYHNGDWGDMKFIKAIRSDIKVHLLMGNWDYYEVEQSKHKVEAWRDHWLGEGFASIHLQPYILPLGENLSAWMCHKPSERNMLMFNLFGHIHRAALVKRNGLNVGVDQHNYKPIPLKDVLFWKDTIENHYDAEEWME